MKKTLQLNLIRKWFDMIKSLIKKEEYRGITPYWCARLLLWKGKKKNMKFWQGRKLGFFGESLEDGIIHHLETQEISFINHDTITFSNGYAKDRDQFEIELKRITTGKGNPDWGAIPGRKYFVLELSKIL